MNLSKRLCAIVELIPVSRCVADIGTDHAFVPVAAVQRGICESAIAADVKEGPLARAREHIEKANLTDRIRTLLSDGFDGLQNGDADCAVLAGMGGLTILDILQRGRPLEKGIRTLVVSPQSETKEVREYFYENKFRMDEEKLIFEDGKYYPLMRLRCGEKDTYAEAFDEIRKDTLFRYGPLLIGRRDAVLQRLLSDRCRVYAKILRSLENSTDTARKEEVSALLKEGELLLNCMNQEAR